jgi:Skp family chaperone for outer membrane proteins
MSDLRAIAESIKASRDERHRLTQKRVQLIAQKRDDTKKLLAHFAEEHQRLSKQDAQTRAGMLNAIRTRVNTVQAEAKGLVKTFERERQEMAQTLLSEAKALHQKLASENQARLAIQKTLMNRITTEHQAISNLVRTIAADVQRQLKTHEQIRRDGRDAWNRLLGGGHAQATIQTSSAVPASTQTSPATDMPFAINIPFAPPQRKKRT